MRSLLRPRPRPAGRPAWRVAIDTGGTFTDCLAASPRGEPRRVKVLSSAALRGEVAAVLAGGRRLEVTGSWAAGAAGSPPPPPGFFAGCRCRLLGLPGRGPGIAVLDSRPAAGGRVEVDLAFPLRGASPGAACELASPEEAPVLAARLATGTPHGRPLPRMALRLATTRGTNALLERKGAPTALFVTAGFGDLLRIGDQRRSDLFSLAVEKPEPWHAAVVEVPERLAADGSVLRPLDLAALEPEVERLRQAGITGAAVALLHSYRNPAHERALAAWLARRGFADVSRASELAPRVRILPRAETAVVDAYLAPVVRGYLERVRLALSRGSTLHVMTSAGGLARAPDFRPKDSLLSGPAGGVVGAALAGRRSGFPRLISFDMGGTSTDVARWDGDFEYRFETEVAGARILSPSLAVETVAAGGGSVCSFDGERLRVGPDSAGATPGPACYGAGGPLTLTDVNLLLGRLDPGRFEIPVDPEAARAAAAQLLAAAAEGAPPSPRPRPESFLEGLLRIADERMADAIRTISVRRGYDPGDYALVAFGGAGGQHACAVAALLGITAVLVPAGAGLLSAFGLEQARLERFEERQILRPLAAVEGSLAAVVAELSARAVAAVRAEGVPAEDIEVRRRLVALRLAGQEAALSIESDSPGRLAEAFATAYRELYGYLPPPRPVEVESVRVVAASRGAEVAAPGPVAVSAAAAGDRRRLFLAGRWRVAAVYAREELASGATFCGPALVVERHAATLVADDWRARVDGAGALVLTREEGA